MKSKLFKIKGAGGGKGGGQSPVETSDTLFSSQKVRILDLISEGEIEGLGVDPLKSVFLDGTPIQNGDDSFNFFGVKLWERLGTQAQTHIRGIPSIESSSAVGIEVTNSLPHTETINDSTVDDVIVTVNTPSLLFTDQKTGDIEGSSFSFILEVDVDGGGFSTFITDTIKGKSTNGFSKDYKIELPAGTTRQVRMTRTSADSNSALLANKSIWQTITEVKNDKLTYPNSAVYGLQMDSAQFNKVPVRGYLVKGLKIQIPDNYNPITRAYSPSVWGGAFTTAWTDNPAWIFYDLATNDRYGLGQFITPALINKFDLYAIGQYCDTLVDDGFGGSEPRFTCNTQISNAKEAYELLVELASVFRGMPYWSGGQITAVQDSPASPIALFNATNVEGGDFSYSGSSISARHTVAHVTWNDPNNLYKQEVEYVENPAGIERYGIREKRIIGIGVTSRGQANRVGLWALYSEVNETETVAFTTGYEATLLFPGAIIQIQDPNKTSKDFGGRVPTGATTTSIPLDQTVTLETGKTYSLNIILPDGTVENQPVTNAVPGSYSTLTVSPAFTTAPQAQSVWILESDIEVPTEWRILAVTEGEGINREVLAIQHDSTKFSQVESGIILTTKPEDLRKGTISPPANVTLDEYLVSNDGEVTSVLKVQWDEVLKAETYAVRWRRGNENWVGVDGIQNNYWELPGAIKGIYTVQVTAFDGKGLSSIPTTETGQVQGIDGLELAPLVTGLELFEQGNETDFAGRDAKFTWRKASNLSSFELGSEPEGANSGALDAFFKDYEIRIYDTNDLDTRKLLRSEFVTDNFYTYTWEKNIEDAKFRAVPDQNIPYRSFVIEVYQRNINNALSAFPAKLQVQNPAPALPSQITFSKAVYNHFIDYEPPLGDHDWVGMIVWRSETPGFTPGQSNKVFKAPDSFIVLEGVPGTTYYYRYATYDAFDEVGLNISAEQVVVMNRIDTPDIEAGAVTADKILAASITADKYNQLRNSQLITFGDSLDATHPFEIVFPISSELEPNGIKAVNLSFQILNYRAYSTGVASGGANTPTSNSGGSSTPTSSNTTGGTHNHTETTGNSNPSASLIIYYDGVNNRFVNGSGGTITIDTGDGHTHTVTVTNASTSGLQQVYWSVTQGQLTCNGGGVIFTNTTNNHEHELIIGNYNAGDTNQTFGESANTFVVNGGTRLLTFGLGPSGHTHTVTIGNHTHDVVIPNHTHGVDYNIFEEANSPTINVFVDDGSGYGSSIGAYTADQLEVDIKSHFAGSTGIKRIKFESTTRARIMTTVELKIDIAA